FSPCGYVGRRPVVTPTPGGAGRGGCSRVGGVGNHECIGLMEKHLRILVHSYPHPGPLPSDGRGRIVLRRSAYPTALEVARAGSGCSLSRRTGEGQGEGRFVRIAHPVRRL